MDWLKCWSKKQLDEIGLRALGGRTGLVVMGGDLCSKGREFESRQHILDRLFSHFCCKDCYVCLKRRK